jgi:cytochrome c-type biogenesis protein CcmH
MSGSAGSRPASLLGAALVLLLLAAAAALAVQTARPHAGAQVEIDQLAATPQGRREALIQQLERRPRDGRGWMLLGMMELEADRFDAAARAFERAIAASPRVAADPAVWCEYADALGMAQGGSLAGRPTELIHRALALRGDHPKALEMAGSAAYERRDFASAADYWRRLQAQLTAGTEAHDQLTAAIERARRLAATSLP